MAPPKHWATRSPGGQTIRPHPGEHSPMPPTPLSVDTRPSAVRGFKGYARTSVIFAVIAIPPRERLMRLHGPMVLRMRGASAHPGAL